MSRLQPVGQKRLTNICIVRLKRGGKRFEVAAYRNTVVAWRNGVEKDIDEVLQVHTIFANLDKGILAKSEDLIEAFGTDNEDQVCVDILNKGEFQVSEQERQMQVDALFRDVATRVSDMCVNPETQRPYPLSTIERAMREELHFAPSLNRAAKQQALAVIKQLEAADVLPIARARMHVRLVVPAERLAGAQAALRALRGDAEAAPAADADSAGAPGGGASSGRGAQSAAPSSAPPSSAAEAKLSIGPSETTAAGSATLTCHADPGLFRALSELAKEMGGSLQVIELKASGAVDASHGSATADAAPAAAPSAALPPTAPPSAVPAAGTSGASGASGAGGGDATTEGGAARGGAAARAPASSGRSDADAKRAERMYKLNLRNAEKGDPVAQLEVGKALLDGRGVDVDVAKGREWLEQAAQQGVKAATSRLEALEIS
jgi:ribosome maturation protein SDO1